LQTIAELAVPGSEKGDEQVAAVMSSLDALRTSNIEASDETLTAAFDAVMSVTKNNEATTQTTTTTDADGNTVTTQTTTATAATDTESVKRDLCSTMVIGLNEGESKEVKSGNSTIVSTLAADNTDVAVTGDGFEVAIPLSSPTARRRM
jgi:hypothetical protein